MLRVIYDAIGVLAAPLLETSNTVVVDSVLYANLSTHIFDGDWAYLTLDDGKKVEVVRVYRASSWGVFILRGQDNTVPSRFNTGTTIRYQLTAQEVAEKVVGYPLQLFRSGGITLDGNTIGYQMPVIEQKGGTFGNISSNQIDLGRIEEAYGCCDVDTPGAPGIGLPYLYLTSLVYPIEVEDGYQVATALTGGRVQGVIRDAYSVSNTLTGGTLLTLVHVYDAPRVDAYTVSNALTGGTLFTLVHVYDAPRVDAYSVSNALTGGSLVRVVVTTDVPRDAYTVDMALTGGTLA